MSGMLVAKSARVHGRAVKTLVGGALLFCVMGSGLSQTHPQPYTFFKIVEVFRTKMPGSALPTKIRIAASREMVIPTVSARIAWLQQGQC